MIEHLQSGDQAMAPEGSSWQAMPHFCETGSILLLPTTAGRVFPGGEAGGDTTLSPAIKALSSAQKFPENNSLLLKIPLLVNLLGKTLAGQASS